MKSALLQIAAIRSGIIVFAENATKDAAAAENPTISTKVMLAPLRVQMGLPPARRASHSPLKRVVGTLAMAGPH